MSYFYLILIILDDNRVFILFVSLIQKSSFVKEGSGIVRPKGTTLERAIRDLEKIVSACKPQDLSLSHSLSL